MSTKELFLWIWVLLLSVMLAMVTVRLYQMPVIVSFDLQHSVKQFSYDLSIKKVSEEEKNRLTKAFSQCLVSVTEAYASNHHAIIVVSQALVSGTNDVTQEIQRDINRVLSDER